ncbi:MAG: NUDIX hydrolase [Clostridium sp.]|jgi:8-oxo-dGTP diphosphatase|uniref:NUDIX hydrolase n=1 Tax=unclassified Clostridium TaxID=2614128 RepID=UPI00095DC6FA|nr:MULTISPECIES: NUDIX domain-containing protein [unclassified Clostridium]MBS6768133.1 NUDIX domain-containing protein [Clostridium sp.]OKZ64690.1 MAG: DNA mismatch repair protein MutT [Clostridium sp. 42_12]RHQ10893.1 NUDIX domain-containing protein [Clostridium sp. AM49-4BH]RHV16264.1 NUDIX domain-containing protein [Clostridium sp. OM05-9BH]RHV19283.1 NUDIX domain-containing protein [Clostridium sp. OM05-6BH]
MELWDIYDKDKKPTGRTMKRNDWCLKEGEYHLSVLGVIQRPDGKYLITKRAADKAWAPGWWEVSGGAAIAGETSEEAVKREILEETGLDVTNAEGGFLFSYHRENPGEGDNYFVDVYKYHMDFTEEDIKLQTEETNAFQIADAAQLSEYDKQGIFLHYQSIKQALQ